MCGVHNAYFVSRDDVSEQFCSANGTVLPMITPEAKGNLLMACIDQLCELRFNLADQFWELVMVDDLLCNFVVPPIVPCLAARIPKFADIPPHSERRQRLINLSCPVWHVCGL